MTNEQFRFIIQLVLVLSGKCNNRAEFEKLVRECIEGKEKEEVPTTTT